MKLFAKSEQALPKAPANLAELQRIQTEILEVRREMEAAYNRFQHEINPDLIDCYIFESNAAWKKYSFLLKQLKS